MSCFSLAELAKKVGGQVRGDGDIQVSGLSTLQAARQNQLSFLANPAYVKYLPETQAAAVILTPAQADQFDGVSLVHDNPYLAYAQLSHLWDPLACVVPRISTEAVIDGNASIGEGVYIGPGAVVSEYAEIGTGAYIDANVFIGKGSIVGARTRLFSGVNVYHGVSIGDDCTVQAGAVIGSDGFGFAPNGSGWERICQLGGVRIGDRVEIGANTTIDRGALDDTVISNGVILDNQIQIAHNVIIGENTAIAACSAVAGSTSIGKDCIVGGASGIAGHLEIVDGVHITAMTMVIKSLTSAGVYSSGTGVQPNKEWKRSIARLRRLDSMESRLKSVEKHLMEVTENKKG